MVNNIRYHMTDDGPKKCEAQPGNCKYGLSDESHFGNFAMAQAAYEERMDQKYHPFDGIKKMPSDIPEKPVIPIPTWDEVEEIYDRLLAEKRRSVNGRLPKALTGRPIGFGLSGSTIYGLQIPTSDRDLTIITDLPKAPDYQHIFEDGEDVRIATVFGTSERILEGSPQDIDMFSSKTFTVKDPRFDAYLSAHRINTLAYRSKLESHSRSDLKNALSDGKDPSRAKKSLKTGLRNCVMALRSSESNGRYVRTEFTNDERVKFFRELRELDTFVDSIREMRDPIALYVKERRVASKGDLEFLENDPEYRRINQSLRTIDNDIFRRLSEASNRVHKSS